MTISLEKFIGENYVLIELDGLVAQFFIDLVDIGPFFKLILCYLGEFAYAECINDAAFFSYFFEDFIEELKVNQFAVRALELVNFGDKIIFDGNFQLFNFFILWKLIIVLFLLNLLNFNFIILNLFFLSSSVFPLIHHCLMLLLRKA